MLVAAKAQRTFVLVHGAWHGAWSWQPVAQLLRGRGHRTVCPTLTGVGERAHLTSKSITFDVFIEDVVAVLEHENLDDVILVGHGFGASVAIGAADRMPERLRELIFLDGVLLHDGETALGLLPPAQDRLQQAESSSGGVTIPTPSAAAFGIDDPAVIERVEEQLTPHPLGSYTSPLRLTKPWGSGRPMTYVACVKPDYPPVLLSRRRAQEVGMHFVTLEECHDAMLTALHRVTEALDRR